MNRRILISFLLIGLVVAVVGCAQAGTLPDIQPGDTDIAVTTPIVENPTSSETETPQPPADEGPKIVKIAEFWGNQIITRGRR